MKIVDVILSCIFIILLLVSLNLVYAFRHEEAHRAVYKIWGIDSKTKIVLSYGLVTEQVGDGECNDFCKLAQANVESFGYQLNAFFNCIVAISMISMLMFFLCSSSKKEGAVRPTSNSLNNVNHEIPFPNPPSDFNNYVTQELRRGRVK